MTPRATQKIERHYFHQFRSVYPLPEGELTYSDKPDVLIRGVSTVGIELSLLHLAQGEDASSEQRQARRRESVLDRAYAIHRKRGGPPLSLAVDFDPTYPITEEEPIAKALADLASGPGAVPDRAIDSAAFANTPQLRWIFVTDVRASECKWQSVQAYTVPSLNIDRLREVVASKSEKAKGYQPCDSYWLLLIVDFMNRAQDQEIRSPLPEPLGKSAFERVLLYKPQFAQTVEVEQ